MPASYSNAEMAAVRRYLAGERLGPAAKRSLKKAERKARAHQRYVDSGARDEDFALRQQFYDEQNGARTRPSPAGTAGRPGTTGTSARPGAAPSASRSPAAGGDGLSGAAGALRPAFDAMKAGRAQVEAEMRRRGLDTSLLGENRPCTPDELRREREPRVKTAQEELLTQARQRAAARRATERAQAIQAGAIDAMDPNTTAEQVRERLATLGIEHDIQAGIREIGKPLPKREDIGPNPFTVAAEARQKAERRAWEVARSGKPVDTRRMDDLTFAEYLKIRRFAGGW